MSMKSAFRSLWGIPVVVSLLLAACTASPTAAPPAPTVNPPTVPPPPPPLEPADWIFIHGTILTLEPDQPRAEALAVRGGKIQALGSRAEMLSFQGPDTRVVDLQGRTLMPGFVDSHSHVFNDYFGPAAYGRDLTMAERQAIALQNGITTLGDLWVPPALLDELKAFEASGGLHMRVSAYLGYNDPCAPLRPVPDPGLPDPWWWESIAPTRNPGELLRINGVKVFVDGANCGLSPAFTMPFTPDTPLPLAPTYVTREQLTEIIKRAQAVGHQVAMHAIGDAAIDVALDSLQAALAGAPNTPRHRIEHNAVLRPDQMPRYGKIGVVATIFADYPSCTPFTAAPFESTREMEWAYDELAAANPGLHMAWSSDAPTFDINPLHQLFGFVTRYDVNKDGTLCPPSPWIGDDTFPADQALRMMTVESAYALFRENEVGSLRPGKYADLIVLSDNPLSVDPMTIPQIAVWMTMVGGRIEYCAPGHEAFCPGASEEGSGPTPTAPGATSWSATASASLPDMPPALAIDGNPDTWWSAGTGAPQWIEIDLGRETDIRQIRLTPSQYPNGQTVHRVLGRGESGSLVLLHTFDGPTADLQALSYAPPEPWRGLRYIRIETRESPSWVAWREIAIDKAPGP
jgi:predicted amidohydrolase YtcJ